MEITWEDLASMAFYCLGAVSAHVGAYVLSALVLNLTVFFFQQMLY